MPQPKAPKMKRDEVRERVKRGEHVAIGPTVHRADALTRRLDPPLPPPPPAGSEAPDEFEAVVVRGADGRITRAGMEHQIRHGGSVLYKGASLTTMDDLPTDEEMAKDAADAEKNAAKAFDDQIARIQAQKDAALARSAESERAVTSAERTAAKRRKSQAAETETAAEDKRPAKAATREDWNDYAASIGVQGAADMATKEDVQEACEKAAPAGE